MNSTARRSTRDGEVKTQQRAADGDPAFEDCDDKTALCLFWVKELSAPLRGFVHTNDAGPAEFADYEFFVVAAAECRKSRNAQLVRAQ